MATSVNVEDTKFSSYLQHKNGHLYCEDVSIQTIQSELSKKLDMPSPVYIYSKAQIMDNVKSYNSAFNSTGIDYMVGYSMKANNNPTILGLFRDKGCGAVTVSGNEILLALEVGVNPDKIIFNGNGKQIWELKLAIAKGCMINVDSTFDLNHIIAVSELIGKDVNIFLRINPRIDAKVHSYLTTGVSSSKFGIDESVIPDVLKMISEHSQIKLVGLHSHLGSTIDKVEVFKESVDVMMKLVETVKKQGFTHLKYLNIGGGLGINYKKHSHRTCTTTQKVIDQIKMLAEDSNKKQDALIALQCYQRNGGKIDDRIASYLKEIIEWELIEKVLAYSCLPEMPSPEDLIVAVSKRIKQSNLTLIVEPGRSLIGNTCVLVTKVLGCKYNTPTNYIVVDGSMNEVIRPSLYGAYHHIELTEPSQNPSCEKMPWDVVGPVCECGDFLGKDRLLQVPHNCCGLAVFDVGAYCSSMSSNYNMRMCPAEILVDKDEWKVIRQPDTYEDLLRSFKSI